MTALFLRFARSRWGKRLWVLCFLAYWATWGWCAGNYGLFSIREPLWASGVLAVTLIGGFSLGIPLLDQAIEKDKAARRELPR